MRVYIGCFGVGLGHASRMLEVARELAGRGGSVEFSSSGEVADLIERKGYPCNRLPPTDPRYSDDGVFLVRETLLTLPLIAVRVCQQLRAELANIRKFSPEVVLCDSSLPTLLAAKLLRLPAVTVLNQLKLTSFRAGGGTASRLAAASISSVLGRVWKLSDEIVLPDLPPPYTLSERNLWGSDGGRANYVGFLPPAGDGSGDAASDEFNRDRRPRVFWQVSGTPHTRGPFLRRALDISKALSDRYAFVVCGGDPSGSRVPRQFGGGWYYEWCEYPEVYFESCQAVLSRAGHSTMGHAIMCSKPSILVPIPRQPEQEGNADKAARMGVSIIIPQEELTARRLAESLAALLGDGYAANARMLGGVVKGFSAAKSIADAATRCRRGRR